MAEDSIDALPRTRKEAMAVGSKHYFTGEACSRGHIAARLVSGRQCVECSRCAAREWAVAHPDRTREIQRRSESSNRDKRSKAVRAQRAIDPELTRKIGRDYYRANRAKRCKQAGVRRADNLEKARQRDRDLYADNRDSLLNRYHVRRARKRSAEGEHTADDIAVIRKAQKDRCGYCGVKLKGKGHIDHIIALSRGGSNWPRNIQLLCGPCNLSKGARDPEEFAQSIGLII